MTGFLYCLNELDNAGIFNVFKQSTFRLDHLLGKLVKGGGTEMKPTKVRS